MIFWDLEKMRVKTAMWVLVMTTMYHDQVSKSSQLSLKKFRIKYGGHSTTLRPPTATVFSTTFLMEQDREFGMSGRPLAEEVT